MKYLLSISSNKKIQVKMPTSRPECLLNLFIRPEEQIFTTDAVHLAETSDRIANHRVKKLKLHPRLISRVTVPPAVPDDTLIKECEDLNIPTDLRRDEQFSVFIESHNEMAADLIKIFLSIKSIEKLYTVAAYIRDKVNPTLFIYALSAAIIRRIDTKQLTLPSLCQVFPQSFVRADVMRRCRQETMEKTAPSSHIIEIRKTATDLDIEHRLAYFREDLGINLHHWHWHLVYPGSGSATGSQEKIRIVDKDRRGELFYYMHQQITARYNFERLANNLSRVKPLNDWQQPIAEGYFPKLDRGLNSGAFPGRQDGAVLKDLSNKRAEFQIQDLERMRDRILHSIHQRVVIKKDGTEVLLKESDGIDQGINILGDIVEASDLSVNKPFYGNLHNSGHLAIGFCHDPDGRYLEESGVMGENATAMRDPMFYRWHAFIDNIFQEHKKLLDSYTAKELDFPGVEITDLEVFTEDQTDQFKTCWKTSEVDISGGLTFAENKVPVLVRFTHLDHKPFTYVIQVDNTNVETKVGTVRVFMAPKKNENGEDFSLDQQRRLMIEMDKFTTELYPGQNSIPRKSSDSAITIPYERTFPKVDENSRPITEEMENSNYCNCGWPQHMLVPKGTKSGFAADLFVTISDWKSDEVKGVSGTECAKKTSCKNFASFCGLKDKKYPDARAMGFPFDRPIPRDIKYAKDFSRKYQNMICKEVKIVAAAQSV